MDTVYQSKSALTHAAVLHVGRDPRANPSQHAMPAANGLARQPPLAQVMASASQQGPRPGIQGTVNQQHLSAGAKRPLEGPPGGQPPPKRAATPPVGAAAREGRQDLDDDLDLFKVCLLACACVQGGHSQPPASTEKDASSKTRKNYLCTAHLLSCLAPLHSVVGWHSALPCPRLASRALSIHMLLTTKWSERLSASPRRAFLQQAGVDLAAEDEAASHRRAASNRAAAHAPPEHLCLDKDMLFHMVCS